MLDFDFLTIEQVMGNKKLDIFKNNPQIVMAPITDYAKMHGGRSLNRKFRFDVENMEYHTGEWWTKFINNRDYVEVDVISQVGDKGEVFCDQRTTGARPVIKYSQIKHLVTSSKRRKDGILEVEFGEYPHNFVDEDLKEKLEQLYNDDNLHLDLDVTGKVYTVDSIEYDEVGIAMHPEEIEEFEYKGKKYVRCTIGWNGMQKGYSNGKSPLTGDVWWLSVEPVKWLVDEKSNIAISKNILFAGIQYSFSGVDLNNFKNTDIKKYMDTYFCKEILPSNVKIKDITVSEKEIPNPYNFDFSNVSEEEIIKGCVESNIAVMLHGRSGDGKSARVKELDPDCEILYLINASPDSLGGKSVLINDEMKDLPPTWYTKLVDKCEKEPDKIHIVFFDEITNAPPSIQGMAFNIILDKEVNGKWKLPENARIVAAGNEYSESRSANDMSEPLFNRFAHVYIETKVEDFLKWASTPVETYERLPYKEVNLPMKIHPSIYAFIAYKSFKGEDVLRSEFNGKTPNADPRKWEMASKVLYSTGKPEMLRSLVGEEITREFVSFCQQKVITVEDVLNGNYTDADLEMNTGEKYNTAVGLSRVGMVDFEKVREFVKRLGPEICATFETLWAHGIEERLEKIHEIKLSERTK